MTTRRILGAFASGDLEGLRAATPRPTLSKVIGASDTASRARPLIVAVLAAAILAWSSIPVANGAEPGPPSRRPVLLHLVHRRGWRGRQPPRPAGSHAGLCRLGRALQRRPDVRGRPGVVRAGLPGVGHRGRCHHLRDHGNRAGDRGVRRPYTITVGLTLGSAGWQISTGGCVQAEPGRGSQARRPHPAGDPRLPGQDHELPRHVRRQQRLQHDRRRSDGHEESFNAPRRLVLHLRHLDPE